MPQILFQRRFLDAIRRGEKTTTLRRWRSCHLRAGAKARVSGLGWLDILSCERINLKDLTAADARADGFGSLQELLATLREIYPDQKTDGRSWFRIRFRADGETQAQKQVDSPSESPPNAPVAPAKDKRTLRKRLAKRIRAELDKAVRQSGSLFPL
jgi:hypothetical protein